MVCLVSLARSNVAYLKQYAVIKLLESNSSGKVLRQVACRNNTVYIYIYISVWCVSHVCHGQKNLSIGN